MGAKLVKAHGPKKLWLVKWFYIEFSELLKMLKKKVNTNFVSAKKIMFDWSFFFYIIFSILQSMVILFVEMQKMNKSGERRNERKAMD